MIFCYEREVSVMIRNSIFYDVIGKKIKLMLYIEEVRGLCECKPSQKLTKIFLMAFSAGQWGVWVGGDHIVHVGVE
jgi:hypothetical protein